MKGSTGGNTGSFSKKAPFSKLVESISNKHPDKEVTERICTCCGETKELSEFHKNKVGKYGRASKCKECGKNIWVVKNPKKKINKVSDEDVLKIRSMGILRVEKNKIAEIFGVTVGYVYDLSSDRTRASLQPTRDFIDAVRLEMNKD